MKELHPPTDNSTTQRELNVKSLPVLVILFGVLYVWTGFRGWLVFFLATAGVWLMAWVWIYVLERSLSIERKIHLAWATAGDSVPEELRLINTSRIPVLWVEIMDEADVPDSSVRLVSDVDSNGSRRRHPIHLFRKRGFYTLGPTRLRTSDPFGIYTLTLCDQHSSSILVLPPQLSLNQFKLSPGGWSGDRQQRRGILAHKISEAGVRNYLPGDSLRRIHWRVSAHHDALIVRQLESAASDNWWIFVDLDSTAQAGIGQDSTLELSIVLAASLIVRGLREHRRVGLALAGPKLVWLEPRSDPAHRWRALQALAMATAGHHSLADLMTLTRPIRTATSIVITPGTEPNWIPASHSRRNKNLVTLLVNPTEFGGTMDQSRLVSALAHHGIPFIHMPRSLLEQAYPSTGSKESGKRYMQHERTSWQSMD
jgi:uncharacterized protein (DUF58 family)